MKQAEQQKSELWLIRHGETAWSLSGQHTSRTDIPLTDHGKKRAEEIHAYLHGRAFSLVLTSPRQRAMETCRIAGYGDVAQIDNNLAEWDYGSYDGRTTAEIRVERPGWSIWDDGVLDGETIEQVGARAQAVIDRALAAGGQVALFSHAHFLRILAATWLGLGPRGGKMLALAPARSAASALNEKTASSLAGTAPSRTSSRCTALCEARRTLSAFAGARRRHIARPRADAGTCPNFIVDSLRLRAYCPILLGEVMVGRRRAAPTLTPLELEIMQVLWQTGPANVQTVLAELKTDPPLAYTTVQTMLNVLHRKGKVKRKLHGRAFEYAPTVTREKATSHAVREMVERLFGGSVDDLLMNLVNTRQLDAAKIAELARRVDLEAKSTAAGPRAAGPDKKAGDE